MISPKGHIKLGFSMRNYGYHSSAWRHPDLPTGAALDYGYFLEIARTAERGMLDMIFLADSLSVSLADDPAGVAGRDAAPVRFEPLTLLAALAPATRHIGLVATTSTSFQSPFHIARFYASLDHLSGGRAAWNVITSARDEEARNFGSDRMPAKENRYERAQETVETVFALWDSWDEDACIRDKESGYYFDPSKVHAINHVGSYFQVAGPLNIPRGPQGRPIIVQAGASVQGQELAARTADIVYAASTEMDDAKAFYASLKGRLPKYGRRRDDLKIMPGLMPIVGETIAEAKAKYRMMQDMIDPLVGIGFLTSIFGDISAYDLDGPVPNEIGENAAKSSRIDLIFRLAQEKNLTLRQLYQESLIANNHHVIIGTPKMIADEMEEWFIEDAADGFNIVPAFTPISLRDFVDHVSPELRRRGLVRTQYEGRTLRENMGFAPAPAPSAHALERADQL